MLLLSPSQQHQSNERQNIKALKEGSESTERQGTVSKT